jgi:hypothetical protein
MICRYCAKFARDMHRFGQALRKYSQRIEADEEAWKPVLTDKARQRILHALVEAQKP